MLRLNCCVQYYHTAKTITKAVRNSSKTSRKKQQVASASNVEIHVWECKHTSMQSFTVEILKPVCEWRAVHERQIYMWEYMQAVGMETTRLKPASLSQGDWVCTFPTTTHWRNSVEDVIQYLPIKWCPGACLANTANLWIFKDSSLAAALVVEVGGQLLYCSCSLYQPTQQQQSRGRYDGQQLIRESPEHVRFALMPQGFVKEENISAHRANTPPSITYLSILSGWCADSQEQ